MFDSVLLDQPSDRLMNFYPAVPGKDKKYQPDSNTVVRVDGRFPNRDPGYYLTCSTDELPDWMASERTGYAEIEFRGVESEILSVKAKYQFDISGLAMVPAVRKKLLVKVEVCRDSACSKKAWHISVSITRMSSPGERQLLSMADFNMVAEYVRQQLLEQPSAT